MTTTAFAVKEGNEIKVNTIHEHSRGAKVNWLCLNGWMVLARAGDDEINTSFSQFQAARAGQDNYPEVVAVTISEGAA
ncbi:hypothetical protein [Brucella intermedia]|uniref:Uncharacterized protein n=1 Tax=Brucella intermedia M86 TaxID=1234597 RepID=M5JKJ1_9HYPH|nr:hypothetical protein [Brucella intermedia]ELT47055.1 hypothetical protein D584_21611 [Brucella intermedia M86]